MIYSLYVLFEILNLLQQPAPFVCPALVDVFLLIKTLENVLELCLVL